MDSKGTIATVLIIDDDPDIRDYLCAILEDTYQVLSAESGRLGLELAQAERPDVILLDVGLPDLNGYQVCHILKEDALLAGIPVIFITVSQREADLELAFESGGVDFVHKPISAVEIRNRIFNQIRLRHSEALLERRSLYDSLTDLPNRTLSLDRLQQVIESGREEDTCTGLLNINLDGFKSVNDSFGFEAGDQVLLQAASRIRQQLGDADTLGRLAADEFLVILPSLPSPSAASTIAERIINCFDAPFTVAGLKKRLSASVGVAVSPQDTMDSRTLMASADVALAGAKKQGKASVGYFSPSMNAGVERRLLVAHHLFDALEKEQLAVHYQPQLDLEHRKVVGAEGLLRWTHPVLGSVSPEEFVKEAEHSGLIWRLGEFVLRKACEEFESMRDSQGHALDLAINVSVQQMRRPEFAALVESVLRDTGFPASRLELEVTENLLLNFGATTDRNLKQLRSMGVRLSMDDFGTGYSSLSYLSSHTFDVLKIDRSFVQGMTTSTQFLALVKASISMAHALNLRVVAEGAEELEQLESLGQMGCDYVQGFIISPALPIDEFQNRLQQGFGPHEF